MLFSSEILNLKLPLTSNNIGSMWMKKWARTHNQNWSKTQAGLAQFQVWNQRKEKKDIEISIKAGATLAQQQVGDWMNERKGMWP
jgi:hypothetical protein